MAKFQRRKKYNVKDKVVEKDNSFKEIALTKMAKRQLFITMLSILGVTLFSLGSAYAVFTSISKSKDYNVIKVGTLNIDFGADSDNTLSLNGKYPESDATGLASSPYTFTITNTGSLAADYIISIKDDTEMITSDGCSSNQLGKNYIKYSLDGTSANLLSSIEGNNYEINTGTLEAGASKTFSLRVWIAENAGNESLNKHYHGKIVVDGVDKQSTTLVKSLLRNETNPVSVTAYNDGNKSKMYTFRQTAGVQQAGYTEAELLEYRYIGGQPNNFIIFNNEVWRIIGVFTVEDKDGNKEQRVKIIREESIGTYSTDNSTVENEKQCGKNRWSDARLMKVLNPGYENDVDPGGSSYWNRENKTCYLGNGANKTADCNFESSGLTEEARGMISETKWYLGGFSADSMKVSAQKFYEMERGTAVYSSSTYPRETFWVGHVALMYLSDYGYTYALGVDNNCHNNLFCAPITGDSGNPGRGWIYMTENRVATSALIYDTRNSYMTFFIDADGVAAWNAYICGAYAVRPVVYLKTDVELTGGTGSYYTPYTIE